MSAHMHVGTIHYSSLYDDCGVRDGATTEMFMRFVVSLFLSAGKLIPVKDVFLTPPSGILCTQKNNHLDHGIECDSRQPPLWHFDTDYMMSHRVTVSFTLDSCILA